MGIEALVGLAILGLIIFNAIFTAEAKHKENQVSDRLKQEITVVV